MKRLRRTRSGQSTVEYILLFTGITVMIVAFSSSGTLKTSYNALLDARSKDIKNVSGRLSGGYPLAP